MDPCNGSFCPQLNYRRDPCALDSERWVWNFDSWGVSGACCDWSIIKQPYPLHLETNGLCSVLNAMQLSGIHQLRGFAINKAERKERWNSLNFPVYPLNVPGSIWLFKLGLKTKAHYFKSNYSNLCTKLCCLLQVEDAGFSLNHPNQYFTESQKLLGGGRDVKKEVEMSQRSQENPPNISRPSQANTKQAHEEMGDLDSFFQDEWFWRTLNLGLIDHIGPLFAFTVFDTNCVFYIQKLWFGCFSLSFWR